MQINYPDGAAYTRSVEIKHVTGQDHPETVVSYETPAATGEPYYPVPAPAASALAARYRDLADAETHRHRVFFCGRLAQYRYFNTDEVILEALKCFEQIRSLPARRPVNPEASPVSVSARPANALLTPQPATFPEPAPPIPLPR